MKGWVKHFADGTSERGTDRAIRLKQASWRNGRHTGIVRVESWHDRFVIAIDGTGEFWQSDDCEVPLYSNHSRIICRRIQKQVEPQDRLMMILSDSFKLVATVGAQYPMYTMGDQPRVVPIDPDMVGKWLTLEMDVRSGSMRMSFAERRI